MSIKDRVLKLVNKYKTNDPFKLANYIHVHVNFEELGTVNGYYQYYKRNRIIHINSALNYYQQKLICSHELGHAVLHPKMNIVFIENNTLFSKDRFENEANLFCAHLLLPDKEIKQYINYTIEQLASLYKIPVNYVKLKFDDMSKSFNYI